MFSVCYWTWKSSLDNDGELEHRMVDLLNSSLPLEYQSDDEEDPGLEARSDDDNEEHIAMMSMEEFDSTEEDETKVNRRKQPHSLLVFGMTRWYSAWTVMKRFYELYDALCVLKEECEMHPNKGYEDYVECMKAINIDDVLKILHYLRPLVQAIDYFQRDDFRHMSVYPVLTSIEEYYYQHSYSDSDNCIDTQRFMKVSEKDLDSIIKPRISMFKTNMSGLISFFNDETLSKGSTDMAVTEKEAQRIVQAISFDLEKYYKEFEGGNYLSDLNQARVEVLDYVMDYRQRVGISVSSYFRVSSKKYMHLKRIYKNLMCLPVTSSSVERSFSVHGCFLTSRRMNLSLKAMTYSMLIRMNFVLAERQGWEKELQQYIDTKARIFNCT